MPPPASQTKRKIVAPATCRYRSKRAMPGTRPRSWSPAKPPTNAWNAPAPCAPSPTTTPLPRAARELAALTVEDIQSGASVFPTYDRAMTQIAALDPTRTAIHPVSADDLADTARQAIARVSAAKDAKNGARNGAAKGLSTSVKRSTVGEFAPMLRAWAGLWRDLSGQGTTDDPAAVATRASDKDWNRFEHVVDAINTFRDTGRAARGARSAVGGEAPRPAPRAAGP